MINQTLFTKISNLESELQKLKLEAYFQLPKRQRVKSGYPEQSILSALKETRNTIWQKRYAKKV